jgi:hypothetical protein
MASQTIGKSLLNPYVQLDLLGSAVLHKGFGNEIRSGLLKSIAEVGGGNYAFIHDAGLIVSLSLLEETLIWPKKTPIGRGSRVSAVSLKRT